MSQKRYPLILILLAWGLLSAQPIISWGSQLFTGKSESELRNRLRVEHRVTDGGILTVDDDLVWSDRSSPSRPDKFYNSMRISYLQRGTAWNASIGYRNTVYDGGESQALFPVWQPLMVYDKELQHTGYLKADLDLKPVHLRAYHLSKALILTPYEFDWQEFEFNQQEREMLSDHFSGVNIKYQINSMVGIVAKLDSKSSSHENSGLYDLTTTELGSYLSWDILPSALSMDASLQWQHRDGKTIPNERMNVFVSSIRIRHQLSEPVSGFVHYINRTCADPELSELLLISNYLRGSVRYTLPFEPYGKYHVTSGVVYSPENEASALFTEARTPMFKRLYLGLSAQYHSRDNYTYTGQVGWSWQRGSDFHVFYRSRAIGLDDRRADYIGVGLSVYY